MTMQMRALFSSLNAFVDGVLTAGIYRAKLICVSGPDIGRIARIGAGDLTIGRGRSCELRLTAADVSNKHVRLRLLGGRLYLEDLQGTGGVRIEGCPLPRGGAAPVVLGMQFLVGSDLIAVCSIDTTLASLEPRSMAPLSLRHDRNQYDRGKRIADGRQFVAYLHTCGKEAVVIKLLTDTGMQQPDRRVELAHRIRYLSRLSHASLVSVVGGDTTASPPFVVEAFTPGKSIHEHLAERKRLPPAELGRLLQQACVGLDVLHRAGVMHQMLDSHSVLLGADGNLRLTTVDALGIPGVPIHNSRDHASRYQAPEVRRGSWPTPMSDVYTIGALAYHWATGRAPTQDAGESPTARVARLTPLRAIEPGLPAAFEQVVMRALNTHPLDRYASVAELAQAITRCRL